jgi:hypothetical protein
MAICRKPSCEKTRQKKRRKRWRLQLCAPYAAQQPGLLVRRLRRIFLRRPRKNTAARYEREYRNKNQRKRNVSEGHGVLPCSTGIFR